MYWLNSKQKTFLLTLLVMVMPLLVAGLCMGLGAGAVRPIVGGAKIKTL